MKSEPNSVITHTSKYFDNTSISESTEQSVNPAETNAPQTHTPVPEATSATASVSTNNSSYKESVKSSVPAAERQPADHSSSDTDSPICEQSSAPQQQSDDIPSVNNDNAINEDQLTDIKTGTHIEEVHKPLDSESESISNGAESYNLDNGNTAVLVYEDNRLKSGYILKSND